MHERPSPDDAGTDARVPDARVPDAGRDALAIDAAPPADTNYVFCDYVGIFIQLDCSEHDDLQLHDRSCSTSGPRCQQLEVSGRGSLDDASAGAGTTEPRCYDEGAHLMIHRCAPGSRQTSVRATLLEAPMGRAGVVMHATGFCRCTDTAQPMEVGDTIELRTALPLSGDPNQYAVDGFRFLGEGARFAVEACAYAECPLLPSGEPAPCCDGLCGASCP